MKRIAVLDIGTNSVKFIIGEDTPAGWQTMVDDNNICRLGENLLPDKLLNTRAMERTLNALGNFSEKARYFMAERIIVTGTMCLRTATNAHDFLKAAREQLRLSIQVLSGEEEARYAYLGVFAGANTDEPRNVMVDSGGGSTEIVFGKGANLWQSHSLDLGAVHLCEKFFNSEITDLAAQKTAVDYINELLSRRLNNFSAQKMYAVGGAATSMAAVYLQMKDYQPEVVQGTELTREEVARQVQLYSHTPRSMRGRIVGLQPKRAEIILGGSLILHTAMDFFALERFTVSDRGLRHGILTEAFGKPPV